MTARNNITHLLVGADVSSTTEPLFKVPPESVLKIDLTERALTQHIMKRTLYAMFQRLSSMANRNPNGLIEDLKVLRKSPDNKALIDYCNMWTNHLTVEMDVEGMFEQDSKIMHAICKK